MMQLLALVAGCITVAPWQSAHADVAFEVDPIPMESAAELPAPGQFTAEPPSSELAPSEAWSPSASEPWMPPSQSISSCFGPPPLEAEPRFTSQSCSPPPPPCDGWRVQSSFMPMLGRYGLVAPWAPGAESIHSAYVGDEVPMTVNGPQQCPPTSQCPPPALFPPNHTPQIDPRAELAPYSSGDFAPDPFYDGLPWNEFEQASPYADKYLNPTQHPLVEWGFPMYRNGPVPEPGLEFGATNPSVQHFYVYGDYRAAAAYNAQNGADKGVIANRLNLELDYGITATERIHAFLGPMQRDNDFVRVEFDDGTATYFDEFDLFDEDTDTLFFEGDLGSMIGGASGTYAPFEAPITAGLIPLFFQNGVWMEDAIVGMAMTIPARNSPALDWSNYDVTFFYGVNGVNSPAFGQDDSINLFGATTFIEAKGGYIEAGYAFLEDPSDAGLNYHNIGVSYTRRYLDLVSNSVRVVGNMGQAGQVDDRTANGVLFILENSFLTPWPYNVIPYINGWAGIDNPQSVARAGAAGGILRNEGILFESDNLTGYPTLDATGNNTAGAAVGLDLLAPEFTHQLILEAAALGVYGDPVLRTAPGNQYGIGARYQVPISNATLLRFDVMHGWLENTDDVTGARAEWRWKF